MNDRLAQILKLLSPEALRRDVTLRVERYREEFQPRFLTTDSYDDLIDELSRFAEHMSARCLRVDNRLLPPWRGRTKTEELLEATAGKLNAMRQCRSGDRGGLRGLLDAFTEQLQREAVAQYLRVKVLPLVQGLRPDESLELASAYLRVFDLPDLELQSPALIAASWPDVLRRHGQLLRL